MARLARDLGNHFGVHTFVPTIVAASTRASADVTYSGSKNFDCHFCVSPELMSARTVILMRSNSIVRSEMISKCSYI